MSKQVRRSVRYTAVGILVGMICVRLFSGPILKWYILGLSAVKQLPGISIQAVHFNPFTRLVTLTGVAIEGETGDAVRLQRLTADISVPALIKGSLDVAEADLADLQITLRKQGKRTVLGGLPALFIDPDHDSLRGLPFPFPVQVSRARIDNCRVTFPETNRKLLFEKILIWDTALTSRIRKGSFTAKGQWNQSRLDLEASLKLAGDMGSAVIKLSTDACRLEQLHLERFTKKLPDAVTRLSGVLNGESVIHVDLDKDRVEITEKGKWQVEQLEAEWAPWMITSRSVSLETDFLLTIREGRISSWRLLSPLELQQLAVSETDTGFLMLSAKNAHSDGLELSSREALSLRMPSLNCRELILAVPPGEVQAVPPLLYARNGRLEKLQASENDLQVEALRLEDMDVALVIDPDHLLVNMPGLSFPDFFTMNRSPHLHGSVPDEEHPKALFRLRMASLAVIGKSRLTIRDESVNPSWEKTFSVEQLQIADLDSFHPQTDSRLQLRLGDKDLGKVILQGRMRPFAIPAAFTLQARMIDYPLETFTPYTKEWFACEIRRGILSADIHLAVIDDWAYGQSLLTAGGIDVRPYPADFSETMLETGTLPMNLAIGRITDRQGNLKLQIPFSGRVRSTFNGWGTFIRRKLQRSIRSAAYSRMRDQIMPFDALWQNRKDVAVYEDDVPTGIRLDPVTYPPGEVIPGREADEYTRQLAELLVQDTSLRIRLYPVAAGPDEQRLLAESGTPAAAEKRAYDIARERARVFTEILASHYNVPAAHILIDPPALDRSADAMPRLEVGM